MEWRERGYDAIEGDVVFDGDRILGMKVFAQERHEFVEAAECGLGVEGLSGGGDFDLEGEFGVWDGEVVAAVVIGVDFSI